jgi:hypothetical protein
MTILAQGRLIADVSKQKEEMRGPSLVVCGTNWEGRYGSRTSELCREAGFFFKVQQPPWGFAIGEISKHSE